MDPLQSNEAIQQFMKLLEENGREGQAADLSALMWYIDGMNRQFEAILTELETVRRQLADISGPHTREKYTESGIAGTMRSKVQMVWEKLDALWEKIVQCASAAVQDFKEMGISALDKAVSALGTKKALEALQEGISGLAADARKNIEKAEEMGRDLRSAGAHLKNVGRSILGKEPQTVDGGHEGKFQSVLLAPMRSIQKMLSGMNNATLVAIGSVENLEQSADAARGRQAERAAQKPGKRLAKKPSVRQTLVEKKAEAAARAAATPEKEHKPQEAAL